MAKLKLSAIPDNRPVNITVELTDTFIAILSPLLTRAARRTDSRRSGKADSADADP
ncbi:DUF2274 domain-containing protein [Mesorhizobium sp. M0220]|uniref:DUF2274 domain-containing protein n=1 Tax=Mesorhizobium sp. M0220 TaxID=2956920 RepID=UPI00333DDD10